MSGIIGLKVKYSINKNEIKEGIVLDKLIIREKQEDQFSVTGYLIQVDESGRSEPIPYWRVKSVVQ